MKTDNNLSVPEPKETAPERSVQGVVLLRHNIKAEWKHAKQMEAICVEDRDYGHASWWAGAAHAYERCWIRMEVEMPEQENAPGEPLRP